MSLFKKVYVIETLMLGLTLVDLLRSGDTASQFTTMETQANNAEEWEIFSILKIEDLLLVH